MFNIFKRNKDKKSDDSYHLSYENLAIPEIHTKKKDETVTASDTSTVSESDEPDTSHKASVVYDSVAIPEVHIKDKKHQ